MCKSKADGGKRCYSHTVKDRQSINRQIATQNNLLSFLQEREEKAGQLTLKQQEERTMREEKISELTKRGEQLDEQLKEMEEQKELAKQQREDELARRREQARVEAEQRLKRQHLGEGKGRPRLNLTAREHTELKEKALSEGRSVSRYIADLLDTPPMFIEKQADGDFKRINTAPEWDKVGRKPQSKHGSTITASPTAGLSAEKYDRLTAEAEAFGLTTADYLRRRILNIDPRTRGSHMSVVRQDAEIDLLNHYETEGGLGETPSQAELWRVYSERADAIQEARKNNVEKNTQNVA